MKFAKLPRQEVSEQTGTTNEANVRSQRNAKKIITDGESWKTARTRKKKMRELKGTARA